MTFTSLWDRGSNPALAESDGPEMALNVPFGDCNDPLRPTECTVTNSIPFTLSVDALTVPEGGYFGAQFWIFYGDELGDSEANGAVKKHSAVWPDCLQSVYLTVQSDEAGNANLDSFQGGCLTSLVAPHLFSTHTGTLFTIQLTCMEAFTTHVIDLIPYGAEPAGTSGASFLTSLEDIVPAKVSSLTINCEHISPPPPTPFPTPTPGPTKQPEPGDSDGDGCSDQRENGPDEVLGGQRNYLNPWDFYDVSGDRVVELFADVLQVIAHFAPNGTEPEYDSHYDRGPSPGPNTWNMTAPDGKIELFVDILGVIAQAGHDCR